MGLNGIPKLEERFKSTEELRPINFELKELEEELTMARHFLHEEGGTRLKILLL